MGHGSKSHEEQYLKLLGRWYHGEICWWPMLASSQKSLSSADFIVLKTSNISLKQISPGGNITSWHWGAAHHPTERQTGQSNFMFLQDWLWQLVAAALFMESSRHNFPRIFPGEGSGNLRDEEKPVLISIHCSCFYTSGMCYGDCLPKVSWLLDTGESFFEWLANHSKLCLAVSVSYGFSLV